MMEGLSLKSFFLDKCIVFWLDGYKRYVCGYKMIMSEICFIEIIEK